MNESHYVCWDRLGNRIVILCENGYPIQGVILPSEHESALKDDIAFIKDGNLPLGGMRIDAMRCVSIMKNSRGFMVSDNGIDADRHMTDEERDYITAR